jgi:hypothetical protein
MPEGPGAFDRRIRRAISFYSTKLFVWKRETKLKILKSYQTNQRCTLNIATQGHRGRLCAENRYITRINPQVRLICKSDNQKAIIYTVDSR